MKAAVLLLLLSGCSALVDEGREVPVLSGNIRYFGYRDEASVALALSVWGVTLYRLTGERAVVGDLLIDEREGLSCFCGWQPPGGAVVDRAEGWGLILHEANHAHLRTSFGDPDDNHESYPGPWTEKHNEAVERAEDTL